MRVYGHGLFVIPLICDFIISAFERVIAATAYLRLTQSFQQDCLTTLRILTTQMDWMTIVAAHSLRVAVIFSPIGIINPS